MLKYIYQSKVELAMYFTPKDSFNICSDEEYPSFIEEITKVLEEGSVTGDLPSFDGLLLRYRYFKTEGAKATIVILHGMTEFIQKYYEMIWYMINSGYNVFIFDQRGHGMSGREVDDQHITHVDDFDYYVKDLDCLIKDLVVPNCDGTDIYLFGHSMGGAVALLYLMDYENNIKKALFCSPMIEPWMTNLPRFVLRSFFKKQRKKEGPKGKFIHSGSWDPNPDFAKSTDMSYNRFLSNLNIRRADWHYQNSSASNATIDEFGKVRDMVMKHRKASDIKIPIRILIADDDQLVKRETTIKFARLSDKIELINIHNSKHTIYTSSPEAIKEFYKRMFEYYG